MIGGNRLNPKIEKLAKEIQKTENKIAELQDKLADLKKQKTELENLDYGEVARSFNISPKELAEFLKLQKQGALLPNSGGLPTKAQEVRHEE